MRVRNLLFILLLISLYETHAQRRAKPPRSIQQAYKYTSVGFGGGSSHYLGELAPYGQHYHSLSTMVRWNGTVDYTRHVSPWLSTRLAFSYIRIAGSDYAFGKKNLQDFNFANNYVRNLHFRNDLKELSLTSILNIVEQDKKGYLRRDRTIPYLFAGISAFHHAPKARTFEPKAAGSNNEQYIYSFVVRNEDWVSLREKGTEGQKLNGTPTDATDVYKKSYGILAFSVPLGAGVRLKLGTNLEFALEGSLNITSTDYLDDVGGLYANPLDFDGSKQQFPITPFPADADFYPLTVERILANPSRVPIDGYGGNDRKVDLDNININFSNVSPELARERSYASNRKRGDNAPLDSFLTFRIKVNYILSKKIKCPQ